MTIKNGYARGIRGSTFNILRQSEGYSWKSVSEPIKSIGSDVEINVCFLSEAKRATFHENVKLLHSSDFYTNAGHDPTFEVDLVDPVSTLVSKHLYLVTKDHYDASTPPESAQLDDAAQDLGNMQMSKMRLLHGQEASLPPPSKRLRPSSASGSASRSASRSESSRGTRSSGRVGTSLAKRVLHEWQSFEKPNPDYPFFECHIVPNASFKSSVATHPDNFFALTFDVHNGFDSIYTTPATTPFFKVQYVRRTGEEVNAEDGTRCKVQLRLIFRARDVADRMMKEWEKSFKSDSIFNHADKTIDVFVHVKDPDQLKLNLEYKESITDRSWGAASTR